MQLANIEGLKEMEKQELFARATAMSYEEQLVCISAFRNKVLTQEIEFRFGEADERIKKFKELYEGLCL